MSGLHNIPVALKRITWVYFLYSWVLISFQSLISDRVENYETHYLIKMQAGAEFFSNPQLLSLLISKLNFWQQLGFFAWVFVWGYPRSLSILHSHFKVWTGHGTLFLNLNFNSTVDFFPSSLFTLIIVEWSLPRVWTFTTMNAESVPGCC